VVFELEGSETFNMEFYEAEKLSRYIVGANALLHQIVSQLQDKIPKEDFEVLARAVGTASGETYASILRPLWEEHESLKSEATGGSAVYDIDTLISLGKAVEKMPINTSKSR